MRAPLRLLLTFVAAFLLALVAVGAVIMLYGMAQEEGAPFNWSITIWTSLAIALVATWLAARRGRG